jgi:hypothetical protein
MHELCGVEPENMIICIGGEKFFGETIVEKFAKKIKIWHLLCGSTIWIEHNDRVFNHKQWHESKVKYLIWDDLMMSTKVAWKRVVSFVKISAYSAKALILKGLSKLGGARNVLCIHRRDDLKTYLLGTVSSKSIALVHTNQCYGLAGLPRPMTPMRTL